MAQLKDTLIQGSARVTDTLYSNNINISDIITAKGLVISSTAAEEHIKFSRTDNISYILFPDNANTGIAIGYSVGTTYCPLIIQKSFIFPGGTTETIGLGLSSNRWKTIYGKTGNFSGTVTADRLSTNIFLDFRCSDGPSYIMLPDSKDLIINNGSTNGAAYANLQIGKTGITSAYGGTLGSSTYPWGSLYTKGPSYIYSNNSQWCLDTYIYNKSKNQVAEIYYNSGNADNVTTGQFSFRQFSPKATPDAATSGFHETFQLPAVTAARTNNATYSIITTKNLSSITSVGTLTSNLAIQSGGIWVQGGSEAGSDNTRMALTSGMPDKMPYNSKKRGIFIYSNAIAFADPLNGNGNNDAGWIRHLEETANKGIFEIAVGDDNANEEIVVRRYNTSSTVGKEIKLFDASGNSSFPGQVTINGLTVNSTSTFKDEVTLTKANGGNNFGIYVEHTNPNSSTTNAKKVGLIIGGASGSGGIYDVTESKWIVYSDTSGNTSLNGNTLYLNRNSGASIVFQQAGTEMARFNQKNNLQLGDTNATQNTYKLYVNGAIGTTGKIAFNTNISTEKASYQYINSGIFQRGSIFTAASSAAAGGNATDGYTGARWVFNLGIATPADGDIITIKVPVASHDYGTYISTDNGTTYKPIGILGGTTRLTGQYGVNTILTLAYDADGTINSMFPATGGSTARSNISGGCWRVVNYYDSGFNEWNLRQYTIKAVNAITSGHIIGGTDSGYSNIDSGTAFDIRYAVLYAGSNISAGSTGTNNFIHHYAINIKNSSNANITLTTYKNIYIKGTISGHLFTPITGGSPYVSDITATDDGYAYYYIGRCYSSNNAFTFDATGKSIFWYKNGAIHQYGDYGISFVAYGGTLATNGWKALHGRTNGPHISVAYNNASKDWNTSTYSASLTWGGIGDTHGLIDCCYNSPIVSFGGSSTGNGTDNDPKWYFKLIGTSAQSYTFPTTSKTLAATDGSNASGTWGINISGNAANVTGTVTYQHGGTGLTTLGSAGQVLKVNSSANGIEWGTVSTADEKVKVATNITTAADYPVVFANSNKSTTAAETAGLNKSGTKFYFNPSTGLLTATQVANAIWNDYAEYRKQLYTIQPGYVIKDTDSGYVVKANERLIPGAQIVSDTWGHSMGKTDECQTPVAVAGRVLAYTYRSRGQYHAGMAVCSAPGGTIDIMTREEIRDYPDAIIGIVSEIPDYEEWGSGKVKVDGRIWIKVR